jgi:cyclic beta-1,2-glucan synthetase
MANFSTLITAAGSGYSYWRDFDLTRWQPDTTLDDWGTWIYVRDNESGNFWSATSQPVAARPEPQRVDFFPHRVDFQRRDEDISTHTTVTVSSDHDVEIRQVAITNHSDHARRLSLTSYGEVILTPQENDRRHPAFNRLFIESEYVEEGNILLFRRRARSSKEKPVYHGARHCLWRRKCRNYRLSKPTARNFWGLATRHTNPPLCLVRILLTGTTGSTLDPIFALQCELNAGPLPDHTCGLPYPGDSFSQKGLSSLPVITKTGTISLQALNGAAHAWPKMR